MDRVRKLIDEKLVELDVDLSSLSQKMGRNHAYLQQYMRRGVPVELKEKDRERLAPLLGIHADELRLSPREAAESAPMKYPANDTKPRTVPSDPSITPALNGVPEIDAILGAGSAGDGEMEAWSPDGISSISADVIRDTWGIPDSYLLGELHTTRERARIIEVRGDSMEPTLEPGDRVMVDLGDRRPSPPGLFALWDGIGVVVKRLEHIPNSDPPRFRLMSDNTARHNEYERAEDEINIIGRVIWVGRRI
ncbi:S24 family peptidase [Roseomonas haemaphysalidis]|uniref:Helix-turn-helix transcriptional regulator n=1 Tax=Roseomonas haemaphysalidis TaxID=2768162 RepID=A0ABS3KTT2_9PROT|nr:S24 family peptidase [Roseomonas haemaphysalidis]MBO1080877.1 helix-turn-helix transcriptional regulator [Roseomonas haemaphysalidis]